MPRRRLDAAPMAIPRSPKAAASATVMARPAPNDPPDPPWAGTACAAVRRHERGWEWAVRGVSLATRKGKDNGDRNVHRVLSLFTRSSSRDSAVLWGNVLGTSPDSRWSSCVGAGRYSISTKRRAAAPAIERTMPAWNVRRMSISSLKGPNDFFTRPNVSHRVQRSAHRFRDLKAFSGAMIPKRPPPRASTPQPRKNHSFSLIRFQAVSRSRTPRAYSTA
jgi:hypothetical protein